MTPKSATRPTFLMDEVDDVPEQVGFVQRDEVALEALAEGARCVPVQVGEVVHKEAAAVDVHEGMGAHWGAEGICH